MNQKLPLILSGLALATAVVAIIPSKFNTPAARPVAAPNVIVQDSIQAAPQERVVVLQSEGDESQNEAQIALLMDIQNRLLKMEYQMGQVREGWDGLARRGLVPLSPEDALKYQQLAMNGSVPIEERISALRMLRRHDKVDDGVVQSLAQFAMTSTDSDVRGEIFEQLDGVTNSVLQGFLMSSIANEEDSGVRARLADAMSSFSGDPEVQSWLRHLLESDPDERVKREARQALTQRLERMEPADLQKVLADTTVTDSEKLAALGQLRRNDARSPEVLASAIGLYQTAEDPNVRAEAFRNLSGVSDPSIMEPLLTGLSQDDSSRVRGVAAGVLSAYREDPTVAAWLKYAAENDPDPGVQRLAQAALNGENGADRRRGGWDRGGRRPPGR
jgi:hypothetical protein